MTAEMPDLYRGNEQNLLASAPHLCGEIGVAAKLAVTLVDLADRLNQEHAHHEGRTARVLHVYGLVSGRLCGAPLAIGREWAELRRRPAFFIYQQWTACSHIAMGIPHPAQPHDAPRLDPAVLSPQPNLF